jgi:outer membrane protein OmpA-like peptidoglycan-associated protein
VRAALLIAALSLGCVKYTGLGERWDALQRDSRSASQDDYARECAAEEYGLAQAHEAFARIEFRQGDPRRAAQHLDIAQANMAMAVQKAEECRPKDSDGDGLMDDVDKCPNEPAGPNGVDGCPYRDSDGDGVVDSMDQCPRQREDQDGFMDADGCPDIDNDKDGLLDTVDQCPNQPEDINGFQDDDGCPEGVVDRDGDGIMDDKDNCPDQPENRNSYMDDDGCPDVKPQNVRITKERIFIDEKILFETSKARILSDSYGILDSVAQVLRDYDHVSIRIEGHTDSQGGDEYNQTLSKDRADAVYKYLVGKGIDMARLDSTGVGESRPIDTNRTARGRANNRRVEFHIVDGD